VPFSRPSPKKIGVEAIAAPTPWRREFVALHLV
jgi:hypothetical protein